MNYVRLGCSRCAALAALSVVTSPIPCTHEWADHHDLPERAIHAAIAEPTVAAITTGSTSGVSFSTSLLYGNLTALGSSI